LIGVPLAKTFLAEQNAGTAAWHAAFLAYGLIVLLAALSIVLGEAVVLITTLFIAPFALLELFLFVGGVPAILGAFPIALAAAMAGIAVFSLANALAYNGAVARAGTLPATLVLSGSGIFHIALYGVARADGYGWIPVVCVLIFYIPTVLLGVLLSSIIVRICATALYFRECYAAMPANILRLVLYTAPGHAPELIPGLPRNHQLRFRRMVLKVARHLRDESFADKFMGVSYSAIIPIWFTVGWGYRFVLKSTLWLWWVLFVIGGAPRVGHGIEGLRADLYRKMWSWILICAAVFTLATFLLGHAFKPLVTSGLGSAPFVGVFAIFVLIDWSALSFFQWTSLISSALTILLVIWTQALAIDYFEVPGRARKVERILPILGYLVNLKAGIGLLSLALAMTYIALYLNSTHHWFSFSNWMFGWLGWLYGESAELLTPATAK
jgi:hypothetical protein